MKKPKAYKIIKRLKRVVDSCETPEQMCVAKSYCGLAEKRYDWSELDDWFCWWNEYTNPKGIKLLSHFDFSSISESIFKPLESTELYVTQHPEGIYEFFDTPKLDNKIST